MAMSSNMSEPQAPLHSTEGRPLDMDSEASVLHERPNPTGEQFLSENCLRDEEYLDVFKDLESLELPQRPKHLPPLFLYKGNDMHPLRQHRMNGHIGNTYVYVMDTSQSGLENAMTCGEKDKVPHMPKAEIEKLGLVEMKPGDWIMARSLCNGGDPLKDVVQGFVPGSDLMNSDKWAAWLDCCKTMLGPKENRSPEAGSTPFEQYSDGTRIKPVKDGTRCYQTGFTYEKPTLNCAPNANSKLGSNGKVDELTHMRSVLNNLGIDIALDGFAECPPYMRDTYHELAEAVNMPRLAHPGNCVWPSSQVNMAVPQRFESKNGLTEMGFFGGDHTDDMDLAAGLSAMVVGSHLPENYEAGRFHLLSLGVYVDLANIHVVFFSGRLRHSGTPPLAPSGVEDIETWAYRFVLILYPASRIMLGTNKTVLAASSTKEPVTVPPEMFHPEDASIIMPPEEHFTCSKRMLVTSLYQSLRQLPYTVNVDVQQIMDSITAEIPDINNGQPFKGRDWKYSPGHRITWQPEASNAERAQELFPGCRLGSSKCTEISGACPAFRQATEATKDWSLNQSQNGWQVPEGLLSSSEDEDDVDMENVENVPQDHAMLAEHENEPEIEIEIEPEIDLENRPKPSVEHEHENDSEDNYEHELEARGIMRDEVDLAIEALLDEPEANSAQTRAMESQPQMKALLKIFNKSQLSQSLGDAQSALELLKFKPQQLSEIIQSLDDFESQAEKLPKYSADIVKAIGRYWHDLSVLGSASELQSVWLNISHQRIMVSKTWVIQFLYQDCKSVIQTISSQHRPHVFVMHNDSEQSEPCNCRQLWEDQQRDVLWLVDLTLAFIDKFRDYAQDATWSVSSAPYIPALDPPKRVNHKLEYYRNRLPADDARFDGDVTWNILQIISAWLGITEVNMKDLIRQAGLVTSLREVLDIGALLLPAVWEIYKAVPHWITERYQITQPHLMTRDIFHEFKTALKTTPAANLDTAERKLLKSIQDAHEKFIRMSKSTSSQVDKVAQIPEPVPPQVDAVSPEKAVNFVIAILQDALRSQESTDSQSEDKPFQLIHNDSDNFLALREQGASRKRLMDSPKNPFDDENIVTNAGLFSAFYFRLRAFRSPALLHTPKEHVQTMFKGPQELRNYEQGLKDLLNKSPNLFGNLSEAEKRNFLMHHATYGQVNKLDDGWEYELWEAVKLTDWETLMSKKPVDFQEIYKKWLKKSWRSSSENEPSQHLQKMGKLTLYLLCADLSYTCAVKKPSTAEVGDMIARIDSGAVAGLKTLGLVPTQGLTAQMLRDKVTEQFSWLFEEITARVSKEELDKMQFDEIVLEHTLCKVVRFLKQGAYGEWGISMIEKKKKKKKTKKTKKRGLEEAEEGSDGEERPSTKKSKTASDKSKGLYTKSLSTDHEVGGVNQITADYLKQEVQVTEYMVVPTAPFFGATEAYIQTQ
ncbi:uncharacterized protein B0H18DRAFT_1144304 [Fomitopsis serialis]|uniref:uncharacterized protein n=1 Tax=Fomitopsis serialis TaxID=139415 RepID=UPI002007BFA0|nr:uncharacterized protein B0H18DRAFT_1144304 [Neoantrodia serialis]KAH9914548.1 hypothetical protein B0H18DRAFT_1144304 [Neoantrodia serialis]